MNMTKKELATAAGYTYRRMFDIDRSLPEDEKLFVDSGDGKYDLAYFIQRWVQYNMKSEAEEDDELDTVKAKHEVVKMQKSEIELRKMRGEIVDMAEIHELWSEIATMVMQRLIHLPSKLAPSLVMLGDAGIIEDMIDEEVRNTLEMIAQTPVPPSIPTAAEAEPDD